MITISKEVLSADLPEYLRRVQEDREELIVTDASVPVLKVVPLAAPDDEPPAHRRTVDEIFSDIRGKVRIHGDLTAPTIDEWKEV